MFYSQIVRPRSRGIIVLQNEDEIDVLAYTERILDHLQRAIKSSLRTLDLTGIHLGERGGSIEVGDMAIREETRGLLLPTAIFARWSA
jgi:hypothetical protein